MPDVPGQSNFDTQCGDCGAHFQLDPAGDMAGAACSECGGKRFFMHQPSPTQSDGTLRNMVDSISQIDQGGNPLGEGTIMGDDGEKPRGMRDNYMHSKHEVVAMAPSPFEWAQLRRGLLPEAQHQVEELLRHGETQQAMALVESIPQRGNNNQTGYPGDPYWDTMGETGVSNMSSNNSNINSEAMRTSNTEPYASLWEITAEILSPQELQEIGQEEVPGDPAFFQERDRLLSPANHRRQPPLTSRDPWFNSPPLYEQKQQQELKPGLSPYDQLTSKTAGPAAELAAPLLEGGAAGEGAAAGGAAGGSGLMKALPFALPSLMRGVLGQGAMQNGSMAPEMPTPAPTMEMMSNIDLPMILLADYDTPHSVKSIGEQHDDPENQDQKEFNDGDKSPTNLKNPNNEDTGADGEDGVRDATPGYGIGPNSPSLERAQMILPLLLHYFNSEESGQSDPLVRALHDALEQESPGYLENEHPEGQKYVELIVQNHKSPHSVQAGVNAFPSGLPSMPMPGQGVSPGAGPGGGTCPNCGGALAGDGSCPQCGSKSGTMWGAQQQMPTSTAPTGGSSTPSGGASYPPNMVTGNAQGPVTDEQKQALHQAIDDPSMAPLFGEVLNKIQNQKNSPPLVDPSQMTQPSPMPGMMNPPGAMPGGMDPSQMGGGGGMPMQPMAHTAETYGPSTSWPRELPAPRNQEAFHYMEPGESAMGTGELGLGRCPKCGQQSLTPYNGICQDGNCGFTMPKDSPDIALLQHDPQGAYTLGPGEADTGMQSPHWGATSDTSNEEILRAGDGWMAKYCPTCGHAYGDKETGCTECTKPIPPRQADANNAIPRCPKCDCATTSPLAGIDDEGERKGRCHNCGHVWPLGEKDGHVVLADLPNPILENAAQRTDVHPEHTEDSTLTWKDASGQPLAEGQTYELHTPGYDVPDEVQVAGPPKPDQLDLRLVGLPAGIQGISQDGQKDFSITPQQMKMMGYSFVPSGQANNVDSANEGNFGGMPGLEQIPQSSPTTDETSNTYPNPGTVSSIVSTNGVIDDMEPYGGICHKCGADWIEHTASSSTTTMHECARCGTVWETNDNFEGREAHADLSWIREDSSLDDFSDRHQAMMEHGSTSRNLGDIAANDERLQAVRGVLSRNAMERTAGRHFSPSEQRSLVNERGTARNLEDLDLSNTHYESRYDETGKANPMNVPDSHLLLGI